MKKKDSKELIYLKEHHSNPTISHWIKDLGVKCHIFTIQVESVKELQEIWKPLASEVAAYFQTDFENEYESWNVYLVFLSISKIPRSLKYEIENDKYSSRKIVLDEMSEPLEEEKIIKKISNKIFHLKIIEDEPQQKHQKDSSQILEKDSSQILDKDLYHHIRDVALDNDRSRDKDEREKILEKILEEN